MTVQNSAGCGSSSAHAAASVPTAAAVSSEYSANAGRRPSRSETAPKLSMPASCPTCAVIIQVSERPMLWCICFDRKLGSHV